MIHRSLFFSLAILLCFASCNGFSDKSKKDSLTKDANVPKLENADLINVNREAQMMIPRHMLPTDALNEQASIQYIDSVQELYIIVIEEPKEDFIKSMTYDSIYDPAKSVELNYREIQMKNILGNVEAIGTPQIRKTPINHLDAELVDFDGYSGTIEEKIHYKFGFIEGRTNMYMVMTWTLAEYKNKNNDEMEGMIYSFSMRK